MIKIGKFQMIVSQFAEKHGLKKYEVDILLYGSEEQFFTQYAVMQNVPACKPSVMSAMRRLLDGGWVRIVVERKPHCSRKYAISGKARSMVLEFNLILGNV